MSSDKKNICIIGNRGIGKTSSLIYGAADKGIKNIIMNQPQYGNLLTEELGLNIENFHFMSYCEFNKNKDKWDEPFVVDEIDDFLRYMYKGYSGFSMTINDNTNG